MNETSHVALEKHIGYAVQVWLKSVSNEWYFTLEDQTVFRPYLAFRCSGMNETSKFTLHTDELPTLQVGLISVSKEGYFSLDAVGVSRPYLAFHWTGVNETSLVRDE
jgi:hypothetical protein